MVSTVGIIIDLVILAVFAVLGFIGLKKGFLKSILSYMSIATLDFFWFLFAWNILIHPSTCSL